MLANLRTTVIGRRPEVDLGLFQPTAVGSRGLDGIGTRAAYFDGRWHDTPIFRREDLPVGARLAGPVIVQQLDSTVVIDPGATAEVDHLGNLVIDVQGVSAA